MAPLPPISSCQLVGMWIWFRATAKNTLQMNDGSRVGAFQSWCILNTAGKVSDALCGKERSEHVLRRQWPRPLLSALGSCRLHTMHVSGVAAAAAPRANSTGKGCDTARHGPSCARARGGRADSACALSAPAGNLERGAAGSSLTVALPGLACCGGCVGPTIHVPSSLAPPASMAVHR